MQHGRLRSRTGVIRDDTSGGTELSPWFVGVIRFNAAASGECPSGVVLRTGGVVLRTGVAS
jgi:hypothetical protein